MHVCIAVYKDKMDNKNTFQLYLRIILSNRIQVKHTYTKWAERRHLASSKNK